ncbi:hypothetical protein ACIGJO_08105 [Streptomyces sp. NPDC079020]|uniref:hypothetical protein n=1 Tax=Streptomyces sp. NPDC079020 TaxID=3365722 RepID=UPI0037CE369C
MSQPPSEQPQPQPQPYPQQQPQSQPYPQQPPQSAPQPFGAPPPPPSQPPAAPPQPGYGPPQPPQPAQPVADNPYAQPVQPSQPVQPYAYGQQQPAQPPQQSPYGGYPPPGQPPQVLGGPGGPGGPGKRRTGIIVAASVVALAVVAGGVWFAVGRGSDDDGKSPVAKGSQGTSAPSTGPSGTTPTVQPPPEESETPVNPLVPEPTGTGLQAVWKASDSTMLALGDEYADEPSRINAVLSDGAGFECKGRWQKDGSGDFLEVALLCEQDGKRVESKDRVGNLNQSGDTLTVKWNKGATGSETYERFRDMDPA